MFLLAITLSKKQPLLAEQNVKMKRKASARFGGTFLLTRLCSADYKARGSYEIH